MNRHPRARLTLAVVVTLAGWGWLTSSANAQAGPRVVSFRGIQSQLNPSQWPILGSPNAPIVLVELFDYTCGGCQQMSARVSAARQRYGDRLAVIVVPVVLSGRNQQQSQELTKLALSVFFSDRDKFAEFHKWLLRGPTVGQARQRAAQLIGDERLQKALASDAMSQYLRLSGKLYTNATRGKLPLLASDKFATRGAMQNNSELFKIIERFHNIEPELNNRIVGR